MSEANRLSADWGLSRKSRVQKQTIKRRKNPMSTVALKNPYNKVNNININ